MAKEVLELQMSEMELLQSMYPRELHLDDGCRLEDMQCYINGDCQVTPHQLAFSVHLNLQEKSSTLDVHVSYPLAYPEQAPEVFVRCQNMSRENQKDFNDKLQEYICTIEQGELCMSSILMWIEEYAADFIEDQKNSQPVSTSKASKYSGLARLWIYSHHIYRKELLKKIPEFAKELDLTGFVLPGKPGIICVEGFKENCDIYWQRLKYPNWKHISCKHREDRSLTQELSLDDQKLNFQLFSNFQELAFEAHGDYGLRNDYHMDLGKFHEFLKVHSSDYMFHIFFGIESKSVSND